MTSESVPVLSTEERLREKHRQWEDPEEDGTFACNDGILCEVCPLLDTLDDERAASAARIEALEGALRGIAALQPIGPFRIPTSELQAAQVIARAALTSEAHRG